MVHNLTIHGSQALEGPHCKDFVAQEGPYCEDFVALEGPYCKDFVALEGPCCKDFVLMHNTKKLEPFVDRQQEIYIDKTTVHDNFGSQQQTNVL